MSARTRAVRVPDSYLALVKRFPIREIRNSAEYQAALSMIRELMAHGEDVDDGEADYLRALARFVKDYEGHRFLKGLPQPTPGAVVQFLMEQHGMQASDIGRIIGSKAAASMILNGDREPSKAHIRKLASHFGVSADLFL